MVESFGVFQILGSTGREFWIRTIESLGGNIRVFWEAYN